MKSESENYQDKLLQLGLSEKEAAVYLALLSLGKGTVTSITRKAGINRTTGYDILNALATKGIVSISGKEMGEIKKWQT
jgi:sugar-specific transcriptional regulator TrmB